jgi:hypothetical protein
MRLAQEVQTSGGINLDAAVGVLRCEIVDAARWRQERPKRR